MAKRTIGGVTPEQFQIDVRRMTEYLDNLAASEGGPVEYSEAYDSFTPRLNVHYIALRCVLRHIAEQRHADRRAPITALVVKHSTGLPGPPFWRLLEEDYRWDTSDHRAAWNRAIAEIRAEYAAR